MQSFNPETFRAQQVQEIQAKLEQLQSETGQLMLELTTLYGKYATLLQENISLKSRMGKIELKEAVVAAR
jgi:regulator of replication initiation timing